jgi:hypothetical protein
VKILEDVIDGLSPLRHHGVTLYPADQLEHIFDWAGTQGKRIEWIDAIRLGPSGTQPSMEHSVGEDALVGYPQFRAKCLETALAWIASSRSSGMVAYFEIGISD